MFQVLLGTVIDLLLTNKKHFFMMTQSFETGFSDHHHLIYTVFKSTYNKSPPKKLLYRDYKNWSEDRWKMDLERNLRASHPASYSEFESVFMTTLEANAPLKTKVVRANNKPHVTKELRKAIMVRTNLKKVANKSGSTEDMRKYKDQRNLVVKLNRRKKREYFESIQSKTIENDKQFWKSVKPLFPSVDTTRDRILLIEGDKILSRDEDVSECFNDNLSNITDSLDIAPSFKEVHEDMAVDLTVDQMVEKW